MKDPTTELAGEARLVPGVHYRSWGSSQPPSFISSYDLILGQSMFTNKKRGRAVNLKTCTHRAYQQLCQCLSLALSAPLLGKESFLLQLGEQPAPLLPFFVAEASWEV